MVNGYQKCILVLRQVQRNILITAKRFASLTMATKLLKTASLKHHTTIDTTIDNTGAVSLLAVLRPSALTIRINRATTIFFWTN